MARAGCAIVVGAGTGTGAELARSFAREGYAVAAARRKVDALEPLVSEIRAAGGRASAFGVDASDEAAVAELFETAERELGPAQVAVFNAGGFGMGSILETQRADFEELWRSSALAGFLVGREAARRMLPRGSGTILFTGATASVRASANFAGFAAGKHALRAVAQSMARELGPRGIHVAHVVVDGVIDVPRVREAMPELVAEKGRDGLIDPKSIAATYVAIHRQSRDAWCFEIDLRPSREPW